MYANSAKFAVKPYGNRECVTSRDAKINVAWKMLNEVSDYREWEAIAAQMRREDSRLSVSTVIF